MRILHTADWHLNDRLGRIDRTDDLRQAVERIGNYCDTQNVDVLLVAGDLFSELARPDALRETIRHWQDVFAKFLHGGGTILTLTGNHDNENFCQTLVNAMSLAAPTVGQMGATVPPGRLYLAADPTFLKLKNVQFALMPYPTATHYLRGEKGQKYGSFDEKNRLLVNAFDDRLKEIMEHPKFDKNLPSVLGAHVHVHGSVVGPSLFRMDEREDVVVNNSTLYDRFAYVGLGHIHKPQCINGRDHVRYCGSIETMDLGEANDTKGVVLIDIDEHGQRSNLEILPLPSTKVYEISILDPTDDLPRIREEYYGAEHDLVNLHIHYTAGEHNLEEVLAELEEIFPRWYARDWHETGALGPSLASGEAERSKSFAQIVRDYLNDELIQHTDAEREAILALADELIAEVEG